MARLLSLPEFMERFGTEQACWNHLRRARWGEDGFRCPRCEEAEDWGFIETRDLFQCRACRYQCSITAGTIMQDTKLSLVTWFLAARFVLTFKKGISSHELARQLGVKQETAWYLIQRLSCVVKRRYGRELFGLVEMDETYVGGYDAHEDGGGGRSKSKATVVGIVESKDNSAGELVLRQIPSASRAELDPVLKQSVEREGSRVKTDAWPAYKNLAERTGFEHEMVRTSGRAAHEVLPWIHVVFGNLKRVIRGVHTKASRGQLQDYLDLFCYRFNHRDDLQGGLDTGLERLVSSKPVRRRELRAGDSAVAY